MLFRSYPWLLTNTLDAAAVETKINAMRSLGVPYAIGYEKKAAEEFWKQAEVIAADLQKAGAPAESNKEIIALIAYLQRLGTDIKADKISSTK